MIFLGGLKLDAAQFMNDMPDMWCIRPIHVRVNLGEEKQKPKQRMQLELCATFVLFQSSFKI